MKRSLGIAFMPYAPEFVDGIKIGNYEIWEFYKNYDVKIKDKDTIDFVKNLLSKYNDTIDVNENRYIISPMNFDFVNDRLTKEHIDDIIKIRNIITFWVISSSCCYQTFFKLSSNYFTICLQNFCIEDNEIAFLSPFSMGLDTIEKIKFVKPHFITNTSLSISSNIDKDLLSCFEKCLNNKEYAYLFNILDIFYHTFYLETTTSSIKDIETSIKFKLLSLCMCFDVLLNLDKGKKDFVEIIHKLFYREDKSILEERPIKDTKPYCKTAWWAYDFYVLRNKIVHQNEIVWDNEKYGTIYLVFIFGTMLLKRLIEDKLNFIPSGVENLYHCIQDCAKELCIINGISEDPKDKEESIEDYYKNRICMDTELKNLYDKWKENSDS